MRKSKSRVAPWTIAVVVATGAGVGLWLYAGQPPRDVNAMRAHLNTCMTGTAETRYVYVIYLMDHKQQRPTSFSEFHITPPVNAPDLVGITMRPTGFDARCGEAAASVNVQYTYAMNRQGVLGWSCAITEGFDPGPPLACE